MSSAVTVINLQRRAFVLNSLTQQKSIHNKKQEVIGPLDASTAYCTDTTRAYMREIGEAPLLTYEQEKELGEQVQRMMALVNLRQKLEREASEHVIVSNEELARKAGISLVNCTEILRQESSSPIKKLLNQKRENLIKEKRIKVSDSELAEAANIQVSEVRQIISKGNKAKNTMLKSNLRLVVSIAKKYAPKGKQARSIGFMDLVQEGNTGLIRAIEKFDPTMGYRFSTYACWWIRNPITEAKSKHGRTIRLTRNVWKKLKEYKEIEKQLLKEFKRNPTISQIALRMNMTVEELKAFLAFTKDIISLDIRIGEGGDGGTLGEFIESGSDNLPEDYVLQLELSKTIEGFLDGLSQKEKQVIRLRYGFDDGTQWTHEKIAEITGYSSRKGPCAAEKRALKKLRQPKNRQLLNDYRY